MSELPFAKDLILTEGPHRAELPVLQGVNPLKPTAAVVKMRLVILLGQTGDTHQGRESCL